MLFATTPIIDSLNGFLIRSLGAGSIVGQGVRLIILAVMLYLMLKFYKKQNSQALYIIMYLLVLFQFIYGLLHSSSGTLISDILESTKVIYIFLIIQCFINLFHQNKIGLHTIEKIFKISLILFPLCMVIPKGLGLGYPMYETTNTGFSGFFYAANDLNLVLLVMLIFSLDSLFEKMNKKGKYKLYLFSSFLLIISLILTGAKSSIIIGSVITLVYLFKNLVITHVFTKIKILAITSFVSILAYILIQNFYYDDIQNIIARHTYFYNKGSSGLTSFILTNRNEFLDAAKLSYLSSDHIVLRTFFGEGKTQYMVETGKYVGLPLKAVEMDFWDVFFSYGVFGVLLIYTYLCKYLLMAIKGFHKNFKYSFAFLITFVYSFTGGHVLFSALAGTYLALICCGLYVISYNRKSELQNQTSVLNKNVHNNPSVLKYS
ncbi:O-antigen ligase family protein [Neobacillus cucumis]|nr:O-antigen ligase family protein [Neobacillus cucumis]